jgi:predicted acetyltransferase
MAHPASLVYGKPNYDQAVAFVKHSGQAFAFDPTQWIQSLGNDGGSNIRTLTDGAQVLAGLVFHPTAQWYGGSRLTCQVIASVFSAAEARRQKLGYKVMLHGLRETRAQGMPLAALYATTPAFYRALGFEPAGHRLFWKVPMHHLPTVSEGAQFRPTGPHEQAILHELYGRYAKANAGLIDRTEHFWRYHLNPYDGSTLYAYRIDFGDSLEGYVSLRHARANRILTVQDAVVTTPRSARALLTFLSHHQSVADAVIFPDAPQGSLHKLIATNGARFEPTCDEWLLRIVHVPAALEQRGYPLLDARFEIEVDDPAMPENTGRLIFEITRGHARVREGGDGRLRLDVRALAAIYTGFAHPLEMAASGLVDGSESDLALFGAVFAGPRPTLLDSF